MSSVTSPLIVNTSRHPKTLSFGQVLVQLLRTGLRSNEDNPPPESEDGCYASLLFFIALCSFGSVMIFSSMMCRDLLSYGTMSIFLIILIVFDLTVMFYFMKSKQRWIDKSIVLLNSSSSERRVHNNATEMTPINGGPRDLPSENSIPNESRVRHQKSSLSLIGIYIFGSITLVMFSIDMVQVGTCIPFFLNDFTTMRYFNEDILYVIFRGTCNVFFCGQIAFFVCFKNTRFVSSPWFCYSILMFVSLNFFALLEGLVYIASDRIKVELPWQHREGFKHISDYDIQCYNSTRLFDNVVFIMHDICYPFAIEFFILSIGIFLHHWFSLVQNPSRATTRAPNNGELPPRTRNCDEQDSVSTAGHHHQEKHCSFVLLFAIFMALLLIVSAAMLLFQGTLRQIVYIYHTVRLLYQALLIVPVMLGVRYLSYFRYDRKQALDGSEMLLVSTVTGTFLVTAFTAITSSTLLYEFNNYIPENITGKGVVDGFDVTATDSALCLTYSIVNYFQIFIQTCFFIAARRRIPSRHASVTSYKLCECFLYLAVCNAFILATDTFIALKNFRVESPTNVWFFGARDWNIIVSVLFPVAELYHFHSVLLCSELYLDFRVDYRLLSF